MTGDPEAPFAVAPGEDVVSRLRELGLTPEDVPIVVITHLDPDHCGHNDAFPAARLVVHAHDADQCSGGLGQAPAYYD